MAQGRKPQNVKVENMKDTHVLFALDALELLLKGKGAEAVELVKSSGIEVPKLRGRSIVVRKQVTNRIANRLAGPKVSENLEDLL